MNKREKIIAVIMTVVIVIWVRNFGAKPQSKKVKNVKPVPAAAPAGQVLRPGPDKGEETAERFDWLSVIEYVGLKYEDDVFGPARDPFEKLDYRSVFNNTALEFSELSLSGIIWEQDEPVVLINNQMLKTGEVISGFRVEEIGRNEVILVKGTEQYTLKLYSQPAGEGQ